MKTTEVNKTTTYSPIAVTDAIALGITKREINGQVSVSGQVKQGDDGIGFVDVNPTRDTLMVNIKGYSTLAKADVKTLLSAIANAVAEAIDGDDETTTDETAGEA